MKRCIRALAVIFLVAAITGCVTPPYDPFVISRSEIYERVDTLAMMPLQCPDFDRKEEVSARYETLITERLEAAGFKVVPSEESSSIRNAMIEQLGGMFDPITGQVSEEKRQAVSDHLVQELNAKFEFDAYVAPKIVPFKANWAGNSATWGGVTETVTGKTGFWAAFSNANMSGTIPALSLVVVLRDKTDSEAYYVGIGGIQLVAHYGETFAGGFVDIPESEWFVDQEKDVTAVNIALSALVNEPEPDM
jgi:hypothetical protein